MGVLSWVAFVALFFYLTPMARLASRPLRALLAIPQAPMRLPMNTILVKIGRWEYLLGPFRDRLLSIILLTIVVFRWLYARPLTQETLLASSLIVFYNLLAIITIRYRDGVRLKLAEVARVQSNIHPEDFFSLFYISLSPWPPPFTSDGLRTVQYNEADYRTGEEPIRKFSPLVEASLATSSLARMAMMSFKRVGPEYGRDAFDGLARLWGSRVAQIFKARLTVVGEEAIAPLEGKTLLLFNHKSYLDFALNFFALGAIHTAAGRHLRPRFIAAKEHFIDNPLLYSWIGLGKVIDNAGMIFINRKKGKGWAAMEEAAKKLVNKDVEIAVYPQGTRAYFMESPSGERLDAGYYTTFNKMTWDKPLGHIKPGTANLILDTLIALRAQGETKLNILTVGIMGTAIAGPKGSFKIQTQAEIEFRIPPLWVIPTSWADGIENPRGEEAQNPAQRLYQQRLEEIHLGINQRLLEATQWHRYLMDRTEVELEKISIGAEDRSAIQKIFAASLDGQDTTPFILIDRIFSLSPQLWERFLRLFVSLKEQKVEDPSWRALLQEVSERVLTRRSSNFPPKSEQSPEESPEKND